ncbi:MAG: DUF2156 domain-containing protein [Clostridia bacterium]|nr:DUF2156 domain-containing protein [Clostridia bacterium]
MEETGSKAVGFVPLTEQNILTLAPYFAEAAYGVCDNTLGAVYQWRRNYRPWVLLADGFLCLRAFYEGYGECYTTPIGAGCIDRAFDRIEADAAQRNLPLRYCVVPEAALPVLSARYGDRMTTESVRDWADYLYDAEAFRTYAGKSLHTQRNHVNRFRREHPDAALIDVETEETERLVCAFNYRYAEQHPDSALIERNELRGAWDLLQKRAQLGQIACCLIENGQVLALSIGEAKGDTLFVHVEKALLDVPGAYPAMAQAFAQRFPAVTTVNREDDGGDPGLRYSKLQYKPRALLEKYLVTIT